MPERDEKGLFAVGNKGGPGRSGPNATTVDLRAIKAAVAASWGPARGAELLLELARDRPLEYLKLVCSVLPRDDKLELALPPIYVLTEVAAVYARQVQSLQRDGMTAADASLAVLDMPKGNGKNGRQRRKKNGPKKKA